MGGHPQELTRGEVQGASLLLEVSRTIPDRQEKAFHASASSRCFRGETQLGTVEYLRSTCMVSALGSETDSACWDKIKSSLQTVGLVPFIVRIPTLDEYESLLIIDL